MCRSQEEEDSDAILKRGGRKKARDDILVFPRTATDLSQQIQPEERDLRLPSRWGGQKRGWERSKHSGKDVPRK